jgi:hypothetical protein
LGKAVSTWSDRSEQGSGFIVAITLCMPAQGTTANGIGRRDAGVDAERDIWIADRRLIALRLNDRGCMQEPDGLLEPSERNVLGAWPASCH